MGLFHRIWAAFGRIADAANAVADNLTGLAETFKQANQNVRANLNLPEQVPALPQPPEVATASSVAAEPAKTKRGRSEAA